jgi:hypothetical protein
MSADTPQTATPVGMVAIFADKQGRIIESVSDFDRSGYGGYTLQEGQKMRVQRRLAWAVIKAYCSEMILDGFDDGDAERIVQRLCRKGATVTLIPVGEDIKHG